MAKAVFLHRPDSIYDDVPWERYEFPAMYLGTVRETVGDWILYYEPGKAHGGTGRLAYHATAQVAAIEPHPLDPGRHYARIAPGTYLPFDRPVPRIVEGQVMEAMLEAAPGRLIRAGATQRAVRRLGEAEFARILGHGLDEAPAAEPAGLAEAPAPFDGPGAARPILERLVSRPFRDRAFRRQVLAAYDGTCAISGLSLRNGGGWMEVEAAHIMAVEEGGPDDLRNGLALSATLHRMFDRGLVAVADDLSILVSENKVPREVQARLINPTGRLRAPSDPRLAPHPAFLAHHREHRFGGGRAGL